MTAETALGGDGPVGATRSIASDRTDDRRVRP